MSKLVVFGSIESCSKLCQYLKNYQSLDDKSYLNSISSGKDSDVCDLSIENKYYSAILNIHMKDSSQYKEAAPSILTEDCEGCIILLDGDKLTKDDQALGSAANDGDLQLRLLISLEKDEGNIEGEEANSSEEREKIKRNEERLEWCIDHGFEYIEINEANLLESSDSRDKIGLPRVMEALQSTMWKTMIGKKAAKPAAAAQPTEEQLPAPAPPTAITDTEEDNLATLLPQGEEEEDESEDLQMFEQFASMMAQARDVRDKAVAGSVTDEERRANAAAMAMKFMELFKVEGGVGGELDEENNEEK